MSLKSRRSETGSTLHHPDLAAEVALDMLIETTFFLALHRQKVEELGRKRTVFREIEASFLIQDPGKKIRAAATREFIDVSLGKLMEEDVVVNKGRKIKLFSEVAKFPEVAPHFQRRLTGLLHEAEGDALRDNPMMWVFLASFAEKYGAEIT